MQENRSFARDWQLLKLSRDWKPADRSGEILSRLIKDNNPIVLDKVETIVKDIGRKDADEIKNRMHSQMDINTVLEGILLVSGIAYETENDDDGKKIRIKKEMRSSFSEVISDAGISAVYIRSFIEALIPDLDITDKGDNFTVLLK